MCCARKNRLTRAFLETWDRRVQSKQKNYWKGRGAAKNIRAKMESCQKLPRTFKDISVLAHGEWRKLLQGWGKVLVWSRQDLWRAVINSHERETSKFATVFGWVERSNEPTRETEHLNYEWSRRYRKIIVFGEDLPQPYRILYSGRARAANGN